MKAPDFINVDLEIESKSPLKSLAREFGDRAFVLFSGRVKGRHCLYLEIAGANWPPKSQDAVINDLCSLVESLSEKGRRVWDVAVRKRFDLGYETRLSRLSSKRAHQIAIHPKTLRRVADLGATVAVTIYYREDS